MIFDSIFILYPGNKNYIQFETFFFASLSQILWFEVKCNLMEMFHLMDVSVSLEAWKWSEKSRDIKSWDFHFQLSYHLTHSCRWCLVWICEARSKQKEIRPHAAPWNFYPFNSIMNDQRWRLPTDAKMWWRYVAKEPIPKKCHNYFCDDIINPNTEKLYQSIGF